ncbi:MAG: hypothetical protein RL385_6044 [Pseudomonadota bacterium]
MASAVPWPCDEGPKEGRPRGIRRPDSRHGATGHHVAHDRTTVYRNLVDLAEVGILRRTDVEHTWRFELVDAAHGQHQESEQHAHFVCKDCGKVACLPAGAVALKPGRGVPQALRRGDLEIQLRGVCDACH